MLPLFVTKGDAIGFERNYDPNVIIQSDNTPKKKDNIFKRAAKTISNEAKKVKSSLTKKDEDNNPNRETNEKREKTGKKDNDSFYSQPNVMKPGEKVTTKKNGRISLNDGSSNSEGTANDSKRHPTKREASDMSSYDDFLNTSIPSGNKTNTNKKAPAKKKAKKYPSYYDVRNNPDVYSDYGDYRLISSEAKLLWDNGVKTDNYTNEMYYTDGTIRNKEGKIYKADGTLVNEYGVPIKGTKKVTPNARTNNKTNSVNDFLSTPIPSGNKSKSRKTSNGTQKKK